MTDWNRIIANKEIALIREEIEWNKKVMDETFRRIDRNIKILWIEIVIISIGIGIIILLNAARLIWHLN